MCVFYEIKCIPVFNIYLKTFYSFILKYFSSCKILVLWFFNNQNQIAFFCLYYLWSCDFDSFFFYKMGTLSMCLLVASCFHRDDCVNDWKISEYYTPSFYTFARDDRCGRRRVAFV
jgi:hypothetical protein